MDDETTRRRTFQLLAEVLEYPQPGLADVVRECAALLADDNPAAAACMHEFGVFVEKMPRGRLEEVYTDTLDLNAACYPYVGYHLFGESYQRSVFMLELNERYRAHAFAVAGELPDHLAILLRFLAVCDDAALCGEIVHEALLPALDHMDLWGTETSVPSPESCGGGGIPPLQSINHARQGYWLVLQALQLMLQRFPANPLQQESAPRQDSSPYSAKGKASAEKAVAKTRRSLQRIKVVFKSIAKRKANNLRTRELWYAECAR